MKARKHQQREDAKFRQGKFYGHYITLMAEAQAIVSKREGKTDVVVPIPDKFLYGPQSALTFVYMKCMRIKAILEDAENVEELEGIQLAALKDNCLDLINYGAFVYAAFMTENFDVPVIQDMIRKSPSAFAPTNLVPANLGAGAASGGVRATATGLAALRAASRNDGA